MDMHNIPFSPINHFLLFFFNRSIRRRIEAFLELEGAGILRKEALGEIHTMVGRYLAFEED
jgi:hypothetical protein